MNYVNLKLKNRHYSCVINNDQHTAGYSIHVVSYNLDMLPGFMANPNHNAISFRDPNGEELFAIHGLACDPETGRVVAVGNNNDRLYGAFLPSTSDVLDFTDNDIDASTQIFEGTAGELAQYALYAADAIGFINQQHLTYDKVNWNQAGQNSNSVAHSVVQAMGLEFPQDIERLWAPGHERILLPENWASYYTQFNLSPRDAMEMLEKISDSQTFNLRDDTLNITDDHSLPDDRPKFFDPANPVSHYTPIEIEFFNETINPYSPQEDLPEPNAP